MPTYVYENAEHGFVAELICPVGERPDEIVLKRRTVPDRVAIVGSAKSEVLERLSPEHGYKRLEERGQLDRRFNGNRKGLLTLAQRKAALSMPVPK